jgi:hypothetical protein
LIRLRQLVAFQKEAFGEIEVGRGPAAVPAGAPESGAAPDPGAVAMAGAPPSGGAGSEPA